MGHSKFPASPSAKRYLCYSALVIICCSSVALAQQSHNADLLKQALSAAARGQCPSNIMSALLVSTCQQQMPAMSQRLTQLGNINEATFIGMQQSPNGPAEVYSVTFESGLMTWMISTGSDGKIVTLWSPG